MPDHPHRDDRAEGLRGGIRPAAAAGNHSQGRPPTGDLGWRRAIASGRNWAPYASLTAWSSAGGRAAWRWAPRLKQLGVPTIIVEKNARAGDSWRNRYRSLVLHDPVWYDHMPYLPFPDHWPVFAPKDKMGDWLEMYAKVMELDIWTSTSCVSASHDEAEKRWTVELERAGERVTLEPSAVVFATGAYGPPRRNCRARRRDLRRQYPAFERLCGWPRLCGKAGARRGGGELGARRGAGPVGKPGPTSPWCSARRPPWCAPTR